MNVSLNQHSIVKRSESISLSQHSVVKITSIILEVAKTIRFFAKANCERMVNIFAVFAINLQLKCKCKDITNNKSQSICKDICKTPNIFRKLFAKIVFVMHGICSVTLYRCEIPTIMGVDIFRWRGNI